MSCGCGDPHCRRPGCGSCTPEPPCPPPPPLPAIRLPARRLTAADILPLIAGLFPYPYGILPDAPPDLVDLGTGPDFVLPAGRGVRFRATLTEAASTLALVWPTGAWGVAELRLFLFRADGGSYAMTWPDNVVWLDGAAPELGTVAGVPDVIELTTLDEGVTWYAHRIGCCGTTSTPDPDPDPVVPLISIGSITI